MKESSKRILAGLLLVILIDQLFRSVRPDLDASLANSSVSMYAVKGFLWFFIAFVVGGFVAQKKFLVPALIYATLVSVHAAWDLFRGAQKFLQIQDMSGGFLTADEVYSATLWGALSQLAIVLALALVGSISGMKLFKAMRSRRNVAS